MKPRTMTKAQRDRLATLKSALSVVVDRVFEHGPHQQTPFRECLAAAPVSVQDAYHQAFWAVHVYEGRLESDGRGWIENGRFHAYY